MIIERQKLLVMQLLSLSLYITFYQENAGFLCLPAFLMVPLFWNWPYRKEIPWSAFIRLDNFGDSIIMIAGSGNRRPQEGNLESGTGYTRGRVSAIGIPRRMRWIYSITCEKQK